MGGANGKTPQGDSVFGSEAKSKGTERPRHVHFTSCGQMDGFRSLSDLELFIQNYSDVQPKQISASVPETQNSQRAVCNEWLVVVQGEKECETLMGLGRTYENYRTSRGFKR